jgi:hypothetical protein
MKIYKYIIKNKLGEYFSFDENAKNNYVKTVNKAALFDTRNDAEFYCPDAWGNKVKKLTFVLETKV